MKSIDSIIGAPVDGPIPPFEHYVLRRVVADLESAAVDPEMKADFFEDIRRRGGMIADMIILHAEAAETAYVMQYARTITWQNGKIAEAVTALLGQVYEDEMTGPDVVVG